MQLPRPVAASPARMQVRPGSVRCVDRGGGPRQPVPGLVPCPAVGRPCCRPSRGPDPGRRTLTGLVPSSPQSTSANRATVVPPGYSVRTTPHPSTGQPERGLEPGWGAAGPPGRRALGARPAPPGRLAGRRSAPGILLAPARRSRARAPTPPSRGPRPLSVGPPRGPSRATARNGPASMLDRLLGLFSRDIGIDLGTANTLVHVRDRGIVISRAVGRRDRREDQARPRDRRRGEADGRPDAGLHHRRPPAARRRHQRLRRHRADDQVLREQGARPGRA